MVARMPSTTPLVSVIIPTHNRPDLLMRTLESIVTQSYSNLEIIVVSNGYNDENRTTVKSFNDNRLTYLDQENSGGPSSPRNHGIQVSIGKYLAFCDDDDLWLSNKIVEQVEALEKNPAYGLCYSKMICFDKKSEWPLENKEGQITLDMLLYKNTVPISSVFIKKDLVQKYGDFCELKTVGISEDYEFLLRHILNTKFYFSDDYLIKYWSGDDRTSSTDENRTIQDCWDYLWGLYACFLIFYKTTEIPLKKLIKPALFHGYNFIKSAGYIFLKKT